MSAEDQSSDTRMRDFKNRGKGPEEMRRRRQEVSIQLRKVRKDEQKQKRRKLSPYEEDAATSHPPSLGIDEIKAGIQSSDKTARLAAVQAARKILSCEDKPQIYKKKIDKMIEAGIVPHCVQFLVVHDEPQLQFEAAWVLTNIAYGTSEQTNIVAEGAVLHLIPLLSSKEQHVVGQAVWALGNIAGDEPKLRERTILCGIVAPLLALVRPDTNTHLLRNVTWTISNLCHNMNPLSPSFDEASRCLPTLARLIHDTDTEVVAHACWALSCLTAGSNGEIERVIGAGVVPRLVEMLRSDEVSIILPALSTIDHIITGSDAQTNKVLEAGAMRYFPRLLEHSKVDVINKAACVTRKVTAGNQQQIQAFIDAELLRPILKILQNHEYHLQCEAAEVIKNLTSGGSQDQVDKLCRLDVVKPLCDLLAKDDINIMNIILDALSNILRWAENAGDKDVVALQVEEYGGLDRIEDLQKHQNETIYEKTSKIIDKYFGDEDQEEAKVSECARARGCMTYWTISLNVL